MTDRKYFRRAYQMAFESREEADEFDIQLLNIKHKSGTKRIDRLMYDAIMEYKEKRGY